MIGALKTLFTTSGTVIGFDFGASALRAVQVVAATPDQRAGGEYRLRAAASIAMPAALPTDAASLGQLFETSLRAAVNSADFVGRQAALTLPSWLLQCRHIRVPRDATDLRAAVLTELGDSLPFNPWDATLRCLTVADVAGEQTPQQEVIALLSPGDATARLLRAAEAVKLDVVALLPAPLALVDLFTRLFKRKTDRDARTLYLAIGQGSAQVTIAHEADIRFCRTIPVGAAGINAAIAADLKLSLAESIKLRQSIKPDAAQAQTVLPTNATTDPKTDPQTASQPDPQTTRLLSSIATQAQKLADEIEPCRRYHDATFPDKPVDRILFTGGIASDRAFCQAVAQAMSLAAHVGDPLVRFNRLAPAPACIDTTVPQPAWAAAMALALRHLQPLRVAA